MRSSPNLVESVLVCILVNQSQIARCSLLGVCYSYLVFVRKFRVLRERVSLSTLLSTKSSKFDQVRTENIEETDIVARESPYMGQSEQAQSFEDDELINCDFVDQCKFI